MQCSLTRNRHRWQLLLILWFGPVFTALALVGGLAAVAHGAPGATVTNTDDSGAGSLRQAILDAPAGSTIVFDSAVFNVPQTITLNSELAIAKSLTIDGAAGGVVTPTISGPGPDCTTCFRVMNITGADVTLNQLVIVNGKLTNGAGGGGIFSSGKLTVANSLVAHNSTNTGVGGGISVDTNFLTLIDTAVVSNTANALGGGVYAMGSASLAGSLVQGNTGTKGGGMFLNGSIWLTSTQFVGNTAIQNSGGGLNVYGEFYLTGTQFIGNVAAASYGGGAYTSGPTHGSNVLFQDNRGTFGGGMYATNALTLTDVQFVGNASTVSSGGGLYASGTAAVTATEFLTNSANGYGGGAYMDGAVTVRDVVFLANRASVGGALFFSSNARGQVTNGLLARNSASSSGAVINFSGNGANGPIALVHTTVTSPTVGTGTALHAAGGTVLITDTIVASYTQALARGSATVVADYNLFYNSPTTVDTGSHSISGLDPRFVDPANDNYHLAAGSPAAGAGVDVGIAYDLDGVARVAEPAIGAYEGPPGPKLGLAAEVAPLTEVAYQGLVTYTLALSNTSTTADSGVVVTDVLPAGVDFAYWVVQPPGALNEGDAITWTGEIAVGAPVTLTFAVTNTASGGSTITNTAWYRGSLQTGSAAAAYSATTSVCVLPTSGLWSVVVGGCAAAPGAAVVIPAGSTVTLDADVELTGDFTLQGTLIANGKTVTLTGSAPQTLTGNPLQFYKLVLAKTNKSDPVYIAGKLKVDKKLTITRGSLRSASDYEDIEIAENGVMTLTNPISISGSFTNSGELNTEDYAITFDGGVQQNLVLNVMTWFDDINVMTGTTLIETVSDDNALVSGTLTNYGVIRKIQPVNDLAAYYFGLAGSYAGGDVEVDTAVTGTLTSLQVDRIDANPANPPVGKTTPIHWQITPIGTGYNVTLTLPHVDVTNPAACRRTAGSTWNCGRSQSDATTVTRQDVTAFSDWAVFALEPSTITLTSGPNPSVLHAPVVFTATVTPADAGGSVQVYADGLALGSPQSISGGTAVLTATALALGAHVITATASIDVGPYTNSTSSLSGGQTVNRAATSTSVTVSANPAALGQGLTMTATVAVSGTEYVTPTGVVTFSIGATQELTAALSAYKQAALVLTASAAGTYPITATYSGDEGYVGSAGTLPSPLVVDKAGTTTTVASSANPSLYGQSTTFTATVSLAVAGSPVRGTVVFKLDGAPVYTGTLTDGHLAYTTTSLAVGSHTVAAAYAGAADLNGSSGELNGGQQVVASTVTALRSASNPSVFGQPVTFTAVVTATPGAGTPGGIVTFTVNSSPVAAVTLDAGGTAAYTTSSLAAGNIGVGAQYGGGANYVASTGSLAGGQTVNRAGTSTVLTGSPNPAAFGQAVVFTATVSVTAPGAGTPEGAVAFSADGDAIDGCEAVVTSGAVASCTTDLLLAGSHTLTAEYAGSAAFLGSTSPGYFQVVSPLPLAVNDAAGTLQETLVEIAVLANDLDPAGGGLSVAAVTLQPVHGVAQIAAGSQTVLYTPEAGFSGQDSFVYALADVNGSTDDALVTIVIVAQSQADEPPQIESVDPLVDASKDFNSTAADVEVQLPAGFYNGTLAEKDILFLSYTPILTATEPTHTPPGNLKFGNFEFDLTLFHDNEPQHGVQFAVPLTVTIAYDPALLHGLREDLLDVYFWSGSAWGKDGVTMLGRDLTNHTITVSIAHLSHFGFFSTAPTASDPAEEPAAAARLYLPGVLCRQQAAGAAEASPTAESPVSETEDEDITNWVYLPILDK